MFSIPVYDQPGPLSDTEEDADEVDQVSDEVIDEADGSTDEASVVDEAVQSVELEASP